MSTRARFLSWIACLFVFCGVLTATPAAAQTTEPYDVSDFSELEMGVRGTAYVSQGNTESLEITGPADVIEDIRVDVSNGRLTIDYVEKNWVSRFFSGDRDNVEVRVSMTVVNDLSVNGAGSMVGETSIESDDLRLGVSGAGEMEFDLAAQTVRTEISGAGDMSLSGSASEHTIQISGAGEVDAANLETAESSIRVSGAGQCTVHATTTLDVSVSGAGSVRYKGQPKISQSVSGAGSVKAL